MFYRNEWYDNREQILRGWGRRMPDLNAPILTGLLLYGIFGAAGQIIRAVVALGSYTEPIMSGALAACRTGVPPGGPPSVSSLAGRQIPDIELVIIVPQ
jgi:hypothetical protein